MPAEYVNKLARMFQDIKVSEDLNTEFKEATRNNNESIAGMSAVAGTVKSNTKFGLGTKKLLLGIRSETGVHKLCHWKQKLQMMQ